MQRIRVGLAAGIVALASAAPLQAGDARIDKVVQGLRRAVRIAGDPTWSLSERMQHYGVPGVAITVIDGGAVAWTRVHGLADREAGLPMRRETLLQAGSVSKPVAALAAMRMVEAGELVLDQPVNERLRAWRIPDNPFTRQTPVTLAHLLSHTAALTVHGFGGYPAGDPVPGIVQILDGVPPANSPPVRVEAVPGTAWRYSGGGYTVAQLLMSEVAGQPFEVLMHRRVLAPFGMRRSSFANPLPARGLRHAAAGVLPDGRAVAGKRHTYPEMAAAGLWTTSEDLARFALEMQRALRGRSGKLSRASAQAILEPRAGAPYGLGFGLTEVGGEAYFGHAGWDEGFCALLVAHRQRGLGMVVMINANQPQLMEEIKRAVADAYGWPGYVAYERVALGEQAARIAPGRYRYNGEQVVNVTHDADRLYLQYGGEDRTELIPIGALRFVRRDRESPLTFVGDGREPFELAFELPQGGHQKHARLADDESTPRELLLAGKQAEALAAYRALRDAKDEAGSEGYLNREGIGLVDRQRIDAGLELLQLNTELYPESANTWDSLGYAWLKRGDRDRAREYYTKALAIDPKFPSALQAMMQLEVR